MLSREIERFIEENKENIIEDSIELLSIPSVSDDEENLRKALKWVINRARSMGFKAESLLNDRVGVVEIGEGDETLGMLAHLDVVGIDDISDWKTAPFEGKVIGDELWGRGAMDDKGPMISCLYAIRAVASLGLPLQKKIQLIIGTQEEVNWTDMDEYVEKFPLPDYGFTPDGEFPGTNREKGYADVGFLFERIYNGIDNEGLYEIIDIKGGHALNAVPSSASAVIAGKAEDLKVLYEKYKSGKENKRIDIENNYTSMIITAKGVSTHSCFPEKGINAICELTGFLNMLPLKKNGAEKLIDFISKYFVNDLYGKKLGLYSENEYINGEFIHRTVISPTILESSRDGFEVKLNLRTSYGTNREDLVKAFDKTGSKYLFYQYMDPVYVDGDSEFIRVLKNNYTEITGLDGEFTLAYGTSYAKAMPNIVAWGPIFPGETDYCHEANERISIESLMKAARIYSNAIADIVLSAKPFKQ